MSVDLDIFDKMDKGVQFLYGVSFSPVTLIKISKENLLPSVSAVDGAHMKSCGTLLSDIVRLAGHRLVAKNYTAVFDNECEESWKKL